MRLPVPEYLGCLFNMKKAALLFAICLACNQHLDVFQLDGGFPDAGSVDAGSVVSDLGAPDAGNTGVVVVPTDIIFIVDDSGSMADEQQNLADNFASFVDQTLGAGEYRMGILSADMDNNFQQRGYTVFSYASDYPNHLIDFDLSTGCFETNIPVGCFRGPIIDSAVMDRATQLSTFRDNINVGTCGGGSERGLDALIEALNQTQTGGCNEGFLRPQANLLLVFVSDEDDTSSQQIDSYVNALSQYKPFGQIRVATVVGSIGGAPSACRTDLGASCGSLCQDTLPPGSGISCSITNNSCPAGEYCDRDTSMCTNDALRYWDSNCASCSFYNAPDCCAASPGTRYIEFARAVEAEVSAARPEFPQAMCRGLGSRVSCLADTICQENFGDTLARIAREIVLKP